MPRSHASALVAVIALAVVGCNAAAAAAPALPASETVDAVFATWSKPDSPGCALGVVRDGKLLYSAGYGLANVELGTRNSPQTVFHVASISKQFTAFTIHLLAAEGKLSLDDDIRKHLPELHDFGKEITVRHLLHHTSGLRDQWNLLALAGWRLEDVITEEDILGLLRGQRELNFAPGEDELYSNSGYTLLGVIAKRVSGRSLRELAAERIFQPLGMEQTHFHDEYGRIVKNRAYSYVRQPNGTYKYIALSFSNVGATSLFTTVEDLASWDQNFYDARVGGAALVSEMHRRGKLNSGKQLNYASALTLGTYRGLKTVEHGGSDAGYRAMLLRIPDEHFSVIVLCNAGDANSGQLARSVADLYLADRLAAKPATASANSRKEVLVDPKILDAYVGSYELPDMLLTVTLADGQLSAQATGQSKFPLAAVSRREFLVKGLDARLTFETPERVRSAAVVLHQGGRAMRATRTEVVPLTAERLQAYTGDFYSEELRTLYAATVRDGRLYLRTPRGERVANPAMTDTFVASFPVGTIRYSCSAGKPCKSFTLTNGRVRNLRFERVNLLPVSE